MSAAGALLAHERASAEAIRTLSPSCATRIMRVISRHMQIDQDKVSVKMERGEQVSTLAVDVEFRSMQPRPPGKEQPDGLLRIFRGMGNRQRRRAARRTSARQAPERSGSLFTQFRAQTATLLLELLWHLSKGYAMTAFRFWNG